MDQYLYDYLLSGKAWLLVGSGPSVEMGYPTWQSLANMSTGRIKEKNPKTDINYLETLLEKGNYSKIFSEARKVLGGHTLREILRDKLKPTKESTIYQIIAKWPISVYMTTNYDDEIQKHLATLGLSYIKYTNSEDHFSLLVPDFSGGIIKLHGDLTEEDGLILTEEDYQQILHARKWEYWRTKMTSIFQMNRIIVIGYSISDSNVKHVLEAARKGTGVTQPVIWIAPNVSYRDRDELLKQYRIRVLSYDDRDGQHKNLVRLLQSIDEAVPPRTIIKIREGVKSALSPIQENTATAGFFVFNEFCKRKDFEEQRIGIILSAMQGSLPELEKLSRFDFDVALEISGWPKNIKIDPDFKSKVISRAIESGLLVEEKTDFKVGENAVKNALETRLAFGHMRERFKKSIVLRIKRDFSELTDEQVNLLSNDIESSLIEYFREGGLSLASILFSKGHLRTLPGSIFTFITSASTRYDNLTLRQAFFKISIDSFMHAGAPEIDYLGRLSQGFFAFHGLGVFGDEAAERLNLARQTVWLIDSDTQIRLLAVGCYGNSMFRDCITRLKKIDLRFFTTASLLSETKVHLWYADNVIKNHGQNSADVMASANGETPYRKPNLFMEGFVNWQAAGNPCNWQSYLYSIFQKHDFNEINFEDTVNKLGIEVIDLEVWPGFVKADFTKIEEYAAQIVKRLESYIQAESDNETDQGFDPYRKAKPEAEVYNIIRKEREGDYNIVLEHGQKHQAWFISYTSMLNLLERNVIVTWQPQAFLSFASTICDLADAESTRQAFERIVLGLAQSGMKLLDDETIARVFGGIIEQAKLNIEELREEYKEMLQNKYGEPVESVLARVPIQYLPIAATQIAAEIAQREAEKRRVAEASSSAKDEIIRQLEDKMRPLEKYKSRLLRRQGKKKKSKGKKKHK